MSEAPKTCDWEEKLQDWIDGDLEPTEAVLLDRHIVSCRSCHARLSHVRALDAALSTRNSKEALGSSFDRQLLERIAAAEMVDRALDRARVEKELRDQLAVLSHQQRKTWGATIVNALAGAAVLVALVMTLSASSVVPRITRAMGALPQYSFATLAVAASLAAAFTVVAILVARLLAALER